MTMWMVRAESDGSLFQPFIDKSLVAIGWPDVGDLSRFESRDALVAELREQYPAKAAGWYATAGGMLYRLSKELQSGDGVVSYDRTRRVYAVGKVVGKYAFDPGFDPDSDYPNVRPVEWEATEVSRDALSMATKNSLGSTLTLFQLPETAEEDVWRAARGEREGPSEEDEATANEQKKLLLEDLESRSTEFIKDRIIGLHWEDLQSLVAGMLRAMGYKTRISPRGSDRGKDIVASRDGFGFENPRIVVEVKHRSAQVDAPGIRSFVAGRHLDDKGLYVSTGGFSKEAKYEAERARVLVTLLDLDDLVKTLAENYEALDAETRRLLPLRRIYWPAG